MKYKIVYKDLLTAKEIIVFNSVKEINESLDLFQYLSNTEFPFQSIKDFSPSNLIDYITNQLNLVSNLTSETALMYSILLTKIQKITVELDENVRLFFRFEKRGKTKKVKSEQRKSNRYPLYLNDNEFNIITENSIKYGMNFSSYIRHFTMYPNQKLNNNNVKSKPLLDKQILIELSKIGINLNQIAKQLNANRTFFPEDLIREHHKLSEEIKKLIHILNY